MARPPRSCDRLDDDHMTVVVHRRWGELIPLAHKHHKITTDSVKVLAREDVWFNKRKVREAIKIEIGQPAMNGVQGYELPPPIYDELLLSCDRRQGGHMTMEV